MASFKNFPHTVYCIGKIREVPKQRAFKFGFSAKLKKRLSDLQVSSGESLFIAAQLDVPNRHWAQKVEAHIHVRLMDLGLWVRGEWFKESESSRIDPLDELVRGAEDAGLAPSLIDDEFGISLLGWSMWLPVLPNPEEAMIDGKAFYATTLVMNHEWQANGETFIAGRPAEDARTRIRGVFVYDAEVQRYRMVQNLSARAVR